MEDKEFRQSGKVLTSRLQQEVYALVASRGAYGITDQEVQSSIGRGHGSSSSALSTLHKEGHIRRLREKRGRFTIYVLPSQVGERETIPPLTNKGLLPRRCEGECENPVCVSMEAMYYDLLDAYETLRVQSQ